MSQSQVHNICFYSLLVLPRHWTFRPVLPWGVNRCTGVFKDCPVIHQTPCQIFRLRNPHVFDCFRSDTSSIHRYRLSCRLFTMCFPIPLRLAWLLSRRLWRTSWKKHQPTISEYHTTIFLTQSSTFNIYASVSSSLWHSALCRMHDSGVRATSSQALNISRLTMHLNFTYLESSYGVHSWKVWGSQVSVLRPHHVQMTSHI